MTKREAREKLIDAALLCLAVEMERNSPEEVLFSIFGPDIEVPIETFSSMMGRRKLWDAHLNGLPVQDPPPTEDDSEFIYIPRREYPCVGRRPVRWGTVTKMHYSGQQFKESPVTPLMRTICGLTIPQLAVILPERFWHPGSDETCKLCAPLMANGGL